MNATRIARGLARKAGIGRQRRSAERLTVWPPNAAIRFGSLRRVTPVGASFGADRGVPVDRFYIERFLQRHSRDIRGHTLEVAGDEYTRKFGGAQVSAGDVLHVSPDATGATVIADLTGAPQIPDDTYDCVILTQTLQFIFELKAAIATLRRITRPGGVVLATVPGISQVSRYDMDRWGDYWRFTGMALERLFADEFGARNVEVSSYGNVLAAVTLLHGLSAELLKPEELERNDPDYPLISVARAVKSA